MGIGEQDPGMFTDRRWRRLGLPHARYLAAWDALEHRRQRAELDAWMAAARAAGARVTLSFKHSHRARRDMREFPTRAQFRAAVLGFRRRYPDVRDFIVWNEANHPLSLSCAAAGARREAVRRRRPHLRRLPGGRRRRARHRRDDGVGARLPPPRQGAAADLGAAQLRRRQEPPEHRHARPAGGHARQDLVHRDRRMDPPAQVRGRRDRAGVPVLAARGGGRDAARAAPGMPEPAHPAGVSLQLAGAEERAAVQDDVGLGPDRPIRSAAPGLRAAAAPRAADRCARRALPRRRDVTRIDDGGRPTDRRRGRLPQGAGTAPRARKNSAAPVSRTTEASRP